MDEIRWIEEQIKDIDKKIKEAIEIMQGFDDGTAWTADRRETNAYWEGRLNGLKERHGIFIERLKYAGNPVVV